MKNKIKTTKGKRALSVLLALVMVLAIASPAFSPIIAKAASTYTVELGFNNLFIFDDWACNENSTKVVYGGTQDVGELTTNISAGSFTLKKTSTSVPQVYNGHGMDETDSMNNTDYYSIDVEPNTTYSFSYNLDSINGDSVVPYLFMFDSDFLCQVIYEAPVAALNNNSVIFTTPSYIEHIQFRFTLNSAGTADATFSNISLTKSDVAFNSTNLFEFDAWAASGNNGIADNTACTIDANTDSDTINFTFPAGNQGVFTSYGSIFDGTTAGLYNIPVKSNTTYLLKYTLSTEDDVECSYFNPYIISSKSDNSLISYGGVDAAFGYGENSGIFTTGSEDAYISLVFLISNDGAQDWAFSVKDIKILEVTGINENKISPNRLVATYGEDKTYGDYGTLPSVEVSDNYYFAGWNTKEDGTGMRIAADTAVQPMSYTVYPVIQPKVDANSLTVTTQPTKTIYTLGEKLDTTGLVLQATQTITKEVWDDLNENNEVDDGETKTEDYTNTFNVTSGYYCDPEVLNTTGTQTITVNYGGQSATFTVTVNDSDPGTVLVNGVEWDVTIANKNYTFNYNSTSAFNRYEVIYTSDSYVSGVATFTDGSTEEFFLEPSSNGIFSSYIDGFLEDNSYSEISSIQFTTLDKEFGTFELVSLNTTYVTDPGDTVYFENIYYKMGISLASGGVVSELYDNDNDVYARTYKDSSGNDITQIDYKDKLTENYGESHTNESDEVNLINTYDQGRYLQQSYYGTGDKPYVESEYNNAEWPYNPVQGGNVIGEASKIIDYKITDTYVYIKARPLDWAKWSDDYAAKDATDVYEAEWGDDYITDTYVEAWYYFLGQGDTIKVTNRKVDYSGLPEASHSQEFPALYLVEPLNHFVYNNVSEADAWTKSTSDVIASQKNIDYTVPTDSNSVYWNIKKNVTADSLMNIEEPEYWGLSDMYKEAFGIEDCFEPFVNVAENWAAFTASEDSDSFGVGIYTDATDKFYYGMQPTIYVQQAGDYEGSVGSVDTSKTEYRHSASLKSTEDMATTYIAPTDTMVFKSYDPTEYTYYLTTGTVSEIRGNFEEVYNNDAANEADKTKIAVPETVYLKPDTDDVYSEGQYYVNNVLNADYYYQLETSTESANMYLGIYSKDAESVTVNVTNVDSSGPDITVYNVEGTYAHDGIEYTTLQDGDSNSDTFIFPAGLDLDFESGGGLAAGEKATAKWTITITYTDDSTKVFNAYTVMYAPQLTVGSVAEGRQIADSSNEISSWITGANGVDHSTWSPLGSLHGDNKSAGYFKKDPLIYPNEFVTTGTGESSNDYINVAITGSEVDNNVKNDNNYVMQTATDGHDGSRAKSYLGLLTVDGSRYTNTSQIPNLQIGYDVLRNEGKSSEVTVGALGYYDSLADYRTYYTLGTAEAFTSTDLSDTPDTGWTQYPTAVTSDTGVPVRETVVPEFKVSEIDGKYIHALNFAACSQTYMGLGLTTTSRYATAGTSVLCNVTDKGDLRDAVTEAYGVKYPSEDFLELVEEAAFILGDPSATQADIDLSYQELDEALSKIVDNLYALKYDNLFSAYEFSQKADSMTVCTDTENPEGRGIVSYNDRTITVVNDEINPIYNAEGKQTNGEAYTNYGSGAGFYKVTLKPDTEYVFEYDVTTTGASQVFMFFYNESGAFAGAPTNMSIKTNDGAWGSKSESNSWWGNYQWGAGSATYAIKFTTSATTTQASFRFGNTSPNACTSTFSNIKLIDSARYYEDATYTSVEDVYSEYSSYGVLPTPTRPGYTFNGWVEEVTTTDGTTTTTTEVEVTGSNIATSHKSIFSKWSIGSYTVTYDANGGSVSPASLAYKVDDTLTLPTPTYAGYTFNGWKVTTAGGNWTADTTYNAGDSLTDMYGNVTLTAQWSLSSFTVLFDTILDFSKWNTTSASHADISNVTENGFTLTSKEGVGEGTSTSPEFPVTPGKQYYIDIDIDDSLETENWDVYIFFYEEGVHSGTGKDFDDTKNRFASNNGGTPSRIFTAPEGVVNAVIRLDANGASHSVTFSDIRVYEVDTCATNVDVPYSSMGVTYNSTFGTLPVPTKDGYDFLGWYDADGNEVTAGATVTYTEDTTLFSKWQISDSALVEDDVVIDFGLPVEFNPFDNDTVVNTDATAKTLLGFSKDGGASSETLDTDYGTLTFSGNTATFTPTGVINSETTVYYHASVTVDGTTQTIKNQITIAPASNVYYEESVMTDGTAGKVEWTVDGTQNETSFAEDDIYGWNNAYNNTDTYSNGTAFTATVNSTNRNTYKKTFTFTGTGIDIVSACGRTTGVIAVNIKDSSGKTVKGYVVDTYYSEGTFGDAKLITQVPVVNWSGDYGTYTVEVAGMYLSSAGAVKETIKSTIKNNLIDTGLEITSGKPVDNRDVAKLLEDAGLEDFIAEDMELIWFDDNSVLNGGTGVEPTKNGSRGADPGTAVLANYLDGFRVYNPLNNDDSHYSESEKSVSYANVINHLATLTDDATNLNGIAFIEGVLAEGVTLNFANYQSVGPKDELYLNGKNGVSFKIQVAANEKVMLGLRAVNGAVANVNISSVVVGDSDKSATYTIDAINSGTEMYYDITNCLHEDVKTNGGTVTITVSNTDEDMLAINHIKFSGAEVSYTGGMTARSVSRSGDTETEVVANRFLPMTQADLDEVQAVLAKESIPAVVENGVVTPIVEEEEEIPEDTTPDVPEDDTNNETNTDTDTEESEDEGFSIFSWLKMLLALIEHILRTSFGSGTLA